MFPSSPVRSATPDRALFLAIFSFCYDRVHGGLKALTRVRRLAVSVQQHAHIRTCNAKFGGYFVVCDLVNVHLAHKLASPGFQQNYTSLVLICLTAAEKFAIMPLGLICGRGVFGGNTSLLHCPPLVVAETAEGSQATFGRFPSVMQHRRDFFSAAVKFAVANSN